MIRKHTVLPRIIITTAVLLQIHLSSFSQTFAVSGIVSDGSNGKPLPAANIRIEGTSKETITNEQGQYRLSLDLGSYALIFSYIGYKTDTLRIVVDRNLQHEVHLQPAPIPLGEVVVTDEDPAYAIMRKVIENKSRWVEALKSYRFEAFTRQILRRDASIASISESYITGYWQRDDTPCEVICQQR